MDEGLSAWVSRAVYTPRPNTDLSTGTISVRAAPKPPQKDKSLERSRCRFG